MGISQEEVYQIGYEILLNERVKNFAVFQLYGKKGKNNDIKTEIGRLSKETGISKDKLLAFSRTAIVDFRNRVTAKVQGEVDKLNRITFES